MESVTLNVSKQEANVIAQALNLYYMIGLGHLDEVLTQPTLCNMIRNYEMLRNGKARQELLDLKPVLTGLSQNAYMSIGNEDVVDEDTRTAFSLKKTIIEKIIHC